MKKEIYINGFTSISALGTTAEQVWKSYQSSHAFFEKRKFKQKEYWVCPILKESEKEIEELQKEKKAYSYLDKSVLLALLASRKLIASFQDNDAFLFTNAGVNIGSSRGATQLFENYHSQFIKTGMVSSRTSPSTTLGNLSSWVAQDLGSSGVVISHSITCSTALHGVLNAIAWLKSGMASEFIVGGTEAPLTSFTLAQLKALKLYSQETESLACKSLSFQKTKNTLVLGEAASLFALSTKPKHAKAKIVGIGFANEQIKHSIAITSEAKCFQDSMQMALQQANIKQVDAIIMHAPGSIKGDLAELKAIEKSFAKIPFLTTNKWKIGHTYAASGAMSLELALLMLQQQECIANPFYKNAETPKNLDYIMVNAVGFGGNAVSLIISKL